MNFKPRGIGNGWTVCFCCKHPLPDCSAQSKKSLNDMAAFVDSYEDACKIKAMFLYQGSNCFVDYRDFEPNWIQIKVGACDKHLKNLELLMQQTDGKKTIEEDDIKICMQATDDIFKAHLLGVIEKIYSPQQKDLLRRIQDLTRSRSYAAHVCKELKNLREEYKEIYKEQVPRETERLEILKDDL